MDVSALLLACVLLLPCASVPSNYLASASALQDSQRFIDKTCSDVTDVVLCRTSMSPFANVIKAGDMRHLVHVSLLVTSKYASYSKTLLSTSSVSRTLANQVLDDCKDQLGCAVDNVVDSINELKKFGGKSKVDSEFLFCVSNMQTWLSTSITCLTTCRDGIDNVPGSDFMNTLEKLNNLSSNTLAIINKYSSALV